MAKFKNIIDSLETFGLEEWLRVLLERPEVGKSAVKGLRAGRVIRLWSAPKEGVHKALEALRSGVATPPLVAADWARQLDKSWTGLIEDRCYDLVAEAHVDLDRIDAGGDPRGVSAIIESFLEYRDDLESFVRVLNLAGSAEFFAGLVGEIDTRASDLATTFRALGTGLPREWRNRVLEHEPSAWWASVG